MQQHSSKLLVLTHTINALGGVKGQNTFSSDSSHVAYQIEGNGEKSTMQAHIMSSLTPSTPGVESNGQNIFTESSRGTYKINENGT